MVSSVDFRCYEPITEQSQGLSFENRKSNMNLYYAYQSSNPDAIKEDGNRDHIPLLCHSKQALESEGPVKHGTLVRFRGIIQDMLEPELIQPPSSDAYQQRTPMRCGFIPGETQWSKGFYASAEEPEEGLQCLVQVRVS